MGLEELSTSWHSYPKIYAVGHAYLKDFFNEPVVAEEKVDGSQFSFGIFDGTIRVRSKGVELYVGAANGMFSKAIEVVQGLAPNLMNGWTYRAEYLQKPKHNSLAYDRHPNNHLIIFDINNGHECYLSYAEKKAEAERLGLECVPKLHEGLLQDAAAFMKLLDNGSILGGQKIEGIVLKNYSKFGIDKKVLMAKFVSEAFKEVHKSEWKAGNPKQGDILQVLSAKYQHPARWNKAIQHLAEAGKLTDTPADIGLLMKEVPNDLEAECVEEIKQDLYNWAIPQIRRSVTRGLPEYYKEFLVKKQFERGDLGLVVAHNHDLAGSNPAPAILSGG